MRAGRSFLFVVFLLAALPAVAREEGGGTFYRGMHLGLYSRSGKAFLRSGLDEMQILGIDSVSLVVLRTTPDVVSKRFGRGRALTPKDRTLVQAIRMAHEKDMKVMLFPLIFLEHQEKGEWRGTLRPEDWPAWFDRYERMLRRYARMAEAEGVEILCIGAELGSSEEHEALWRRLIANVRRIYSGKVLYSANWDHYESIGFLDALDYLGINADHRLTDHSRSTLEDLLEGWKPIRQALVGWSQAHGKPLLFTEVGYPSREGAGMDPWNYSAYRPVSMEEQRRCYQAFVETWRDVPELAGAFFYYWWGEGGPDDRDYTPRGKPAAGELARWFRGPMFGESTLGGRTQGDGGPWALSSMKE